MPRTIAGEHADQPVDLLAAAGAALPIARLLRQPGEQMPQPPPGCREELAVAGNVHDRLRDRERDDLRIGHAAPGVLPPFRQEIVRRGEHRSEQQVEVGAHRGPLGQTVRTASTADFDLLRYVPSTHHRVESTI
ncbi:hypothetical protein LRS13_10835 [Svornostia abyssi]|uniref:Uncharacterized protein n=1 Tax=Svornostia abyssi TaxID=2898438 RepID=A0ABY5PN38_9ACTN|nr:hypothetical protein LRS13_16385 [Parviterribacteraceae bacterium J379]UUY03327.1 hypothetical protein LRS13_22075 [Parviterribacteraceae bacterium J379]UUY05508.1 hypothetical protein LRS13_08320 [Parviterribacteraceae bacterium J379]UUY05512.1 hypothetical protein LRS13_08340 [Parviterribacteraceae bacterium J379]UUY05982.1 hypothetical protein LRS13_10835 [Parviterribacteraceae bacterium J379]